MAEFLATFVPALGHALLHFLWQGALIGLLAAFALHALRDARPQTRYAVACFALLACMLVFLASLITAFVPAAFAPAAIGLATPLSPVSVGPDAGTPGLFGVVAPVAHFDAALPWIVVLWSAGTCVMFLRLVLGLAWVHRLRHTTQGALHAAWQARLDDLAARFGMRRGIALRVVDTLDSPVSAGWWRPVVLLPAVLLTRMPTELVEALLAHELAHIRRHDYLLNLLQNVVEALLFYHPVTWWLSHRIRSEREQIADRLAAEVTGAPRVLALALAELAELKPLRPALHLAQAAHAGQLMSRIELLVRPTRRAHPGARIVFPLLGLAGACIATYAYAQIGNKVGRAYEASTGETYALVRKNNDSIAISGSTEDLPAIEAAKRGADSDFLWVRRAGKAYVVTDSALLARAREAWQESDVLSQRMGALSDQMAVHSGKMQALSTRMQKLSVQREPSPEARATLREMQRLAQQQHAVALQQLELAERQRAVAQGDAAQRQRLERQIDALSAKQDELARLQDRHAKVMDAETARVETQQTPMDAIAHEMELASQPMETLSQRMEILGDQQERAAAQAERDLRKLTGEALAKGLAKPVPARVSVQ